MIDDKKHAVNTLMPRSFITLKLTLIPNAAIAIPKNTYAASTKNGANGFKKVT